LKQDYIENKLNVRILAVVSLIVTILEKLVESIDVEIITSKLIENIEDFGFSINTHEFKYQDVT
jgi:DNA-binding transcriptional regulator PaaX